MSVSTRSMTRTGCQGWLTPMEERLDRALVAGLMLEVFLEIPAVPLDPKVRRRNLKSRLTRSLVRHLAGRITLDHFRSLIHHLQDWFPFYYPLMPGLPPAAEGKECPAGRTAAPAGARPHSLVRQDRLKAWLEKAAREILPRRPQSKLQPERLADFCRLAQCCWFRGKDFAQYFDIDRKTAWEYVQKLQETGLLIHNRGRSAAVRYRLADHFLRIKLTALEQQVALALTGFVRSRGGAGGPGVGGHRRGVSLGGALAHLAGYQTPGRDHRLPDQGRHPGSGLPVGAAAHAAVAAALVLVP